jgi:hypothetical protein
MKNYIITILLAHFFIIGTTIAQDDCMDADFNNDMVVDIVDKELLCDAFTNYDPLFDLNMDATVDTEDLNLWLAAAGSCNLSCGSPYFISDLNLDGQVSLADSMIMWENFFTNGGCAKGDLTGDDIINFLDLAILRLELGNISCPCAIDPDCMNGGTCNSGVCDCIGSWTGDDCSICGISVCPDGLILDTQNCECIVPAPIPTLSQWGIIAMAILSFIFGVVVLKYSARYKLQNK